MMRNQMVMDNINLVRYAIKTYHNKWSETDDLFQEGTEALIKAANNYDPTRGVKFSSYAFRAITNTFDRMLRQDRVIRIPEHLSIDDERVIRDVVSYDVQEEMGGGYIFKATRGWDYMQNDVVNKLTLEDALKVLNRQERRYVQAKFYEDKSPQALLKEFGVSRQRLHQIEKKALQKMRDVLCAS